MKKKYIFAVLIILVSLFLGSFINLNKINNFNYFHFELRYDLSNSISKLVIPNKIPKNKYKKIANEFKKQNSNINWFDEFIVKPNQNKFILDINDKYIIKKPMKLLSINELYVFNLNQQNTLELFNLINKPTEKENLIKELEEFCDRNNEDFLLEKGIKKLISF